MPVKKETISDRQKKIALYAKVFSHPVRVYIVEILKKETCCYSGDLTQQLAVAKSTLSQHLKELKKADLIQGEISPPRIKYCLNRQKWEEARLLLKSFLDS
jgi:ArsR family transcriptional regulator, arsenate/arsenite/antimonite-responsive transcriptional repressor